MPRGGVNKFDLPPAGVHVWHWFAHLSASRPVSMNGALPIPASEMLAFFMLEGVLPEPWELAALRRLDGAALEILRSDT